jgi:hypothetical protein
VLKNARPSEYFLGAILRAYDKEAVKGSEVTCSALWDHIVIECLQGHDRFKTMFAWDKSKAKSKNRIGTIAETIRRGHVPDLALETNGRGREVVVESH